MIPVFFTENKAALTEEMNALIDAVLKQHQSTEDSAANNTPPSNRKRKLQFNASENGESEKSVASDKKQRAGGKKQKGPKVKRMATGEKENAPTKVVEKKTPKPNSNQKEKELAKAQAADDAALRFFNAHRLGDVSLSTNPNTQSKSTPSRGQLPYRAPPLQPTDIPIICLVGQSDVSAPAMPPFAPPPPFSPSLPLPLTSGNFKYISSPICTVTQPNHQESPRSMLNLLNFPLDDSDDIFNHEYHSPSSLENTSPSSVGSLFKNSINVLQQSESADELEDDATQAEVPCSNCNVLNDKIRELEQKLEMFSK